MDSDIMSALESVSSVLTDRGFNKEAAMVMEAVEWMPPRPPTSRSPEPTPVGTKGFHPGEEYEELTPHGSAKKHWPISTPATLDEILDLHRRGVLAPMNIYNDLQEAKKTGDLRRVRILQDAYDKAIKDTKPGLSPAVVKKLSSLGKQLIDSGCEELGRKLLEAANWSMDTGFVTDEPDRNKKPLSLEEAKRTVGGMKPDELEYEMQHNMDPAVRKFLSEVAGRKERARSMLASLGEALIEKGYDTLGRRLFEAAGRLSAQVKSSPDKHATPSIEAVFEASKSAKDFEDGVKKLGQMYEDISKLVKELDKEYLDKIMHPLDRKEITKEEAKNRTIEMIRGTDLKIDSRFKTIS